MRLLIVGVTYMNRRSDSSKGIKADYDAIFHCLDIDENKTNVRCLRSKHLRNDGTYDMVYRQETLDRHTSKTVVTWKEGLPDRERLWREQWSLIQEKAIHEVNCEMNAAICAAMDYMIELPPNFAVHQASEEYDVEESELGRIMQNYGHIRERVKVTKGLKYKKPYFFDPYKIKEENVLDVDFPDESDFDFEHAVYTVKLIDHFDKQREIIVFAKDIKKKPVEINEENCISGKALEKARNQASLGIANEIGPWKVHWVLEAWAKGLLTSHLTKAQLWGFPFLEKIWNDANNPFTRDIIRTDTFVSEGRKFTQTECVLGYPKFCQMNWFAPMCYWEEVDDTILAEVFVRTIHLKPTLLASALQKRRQTLVNVKVPSFEVTGVKKIFDFEPVREWNGKPKRFSLSAHDSGSLLRACFRVYFNEVEADLDVTGIVRRPTQKKRKIIEDDSRNMFADSGNAV